MKSVLAGFTGTYTSRYSDLRGYWLQGQLPFENEGFDIDLMAEPSNATTPEAAARRLAVRRFNEQLAKSGLDIAVVRSAGLNINMETEIVEGWQGNHRSKGHMVQFVATAVMDTGRQYESRRTVFVAPHDPKKEQRRLPADWGT